VNLQLYQQQPTTQELSVTNNFLTDTEI